MEKMHVTEGGDMSHEEYRRHVLPASRVSHEAVVDPDGKPVGRLREVMVDVLSGRIAYAILQFGHSYTFDRKMFCIPWNLLQPDPEHQRFVVAVPREQLLHAPGFDPNHWPDMASDEWTEKMHSYYGGRPRTQETENR